MTAPSRRLRGDAGETLIESLISTFVMAVAIVALIGAVLVGVTLSGDHRTLSSTDFVLKNVTEQLEAATYVPGASTYTASASGFTVGVSVQCLVSDVGPTYAACSVADTGLQLLSISVTPTSGGALETTQLMKRRVL